MRKVGSATAIFCLLTLLGFGQPNAWIDFNQDYIRINVAIDGFYRVTVAELEAAGFPSSVVPASRVRLFRRGAEIAIRTTQSSDGVTLQHFDFYGEKNDGTTDAPLYLANAQPHSYHNLFSDTATYFFTWDASTTGLRIQTSSIGDKQGLTPEPFHIRTVREVQTSHYKEGRRFGIGFTFTSSHYDVGEGWSGPDVSKNKIQDFEFSVIDLVENEVLPTLELVIIGRNSLRHVVDVQAGPTTSDLTSIGTIEFLGYGYTRWTDDVPLSRIGPGGDLLIRLTVLGESGASDNVSFSAASVTYPAATDLPPGENKNFVTYPNPVDRSYFEVTTSEATAYDFYDITIPGSPVLLPVVEQPSLVEVVIDNTIDEREFFAVRDYLAVGGIKAVQFEEIDIVNSNYLIITHPLLHEPFEGEDQVEAYADYRRGQDGGGFTVEIADIDQVYDQFNYGDPSPLAIQQLTQAAYGQVEYVMIIGKGRTPNQDFFRTSLSDPEFIANPVMVPTYGLPGGDMMFSINLDPQNLLGPGIPIGRLNAYTTAHVKAYLDKVREMEALSYDELWRKNLIQLSGGQTASELNTFANYIQNFKVQAEGDFLGGKAMNQGKESNAVFEEFPIAGEVNNGVGLITLFGHSSNTVTDIEIGRVSQSDPKFPYANKGKYPFILVNGCRAGDIFVNQVSFGEDWIREPDKGCIGFIANADFASSQNLRLLSEIFYELAFQTEENIGKSIGYILLEMSSQFFQRDGTSDVSQAQIHQTLFQGDPALIVFGAENPDFSIGSGSLFAEAITGDRVLASQDSFNLAIIVDNYGSTTRDQLKVRVDRTLPDGTGITYEQVFDPPKYQDTLLFDISNVGLSGIDGENLFEVELDPDESIDELDPLNNRASISIFIAEGSTVNILPRDLSLQNKGEIEFIWQSVNLLSPERSYSIEIDTSTTFSGAFTIRDIVVGEDILTYNQDFSFVPDSTVIFWRTRFSEPESNEDTVWSTGSFVVLPDTSRGWGLHRFDQFNLHISTNLEVDPINKTFEFETNSIPIDIFTQGTSAFDYDAMEVFVNQANLLTTINLPDPVCIENTINAVALDRSTNQLIRPIPLEGADINEPLVCGRLPQHIYNLTTNNVLNERRIEELINNLRKNDRIIFFNIDSVGYSSWDADIMDAFELIGVDVSELASLVNGQPLIIFGKKEAAPGEAVVLVSDGSVLPSKQQTLRLARDVVARSSSGLISTPPIGPATQWENVRYEFNLNETEDNIDVDVVGVRANGERNTLFQSGRIDNVDVSGIDAALYPFLEMRFQLSDEVSQTAPTPVSVGVQYTPAPESALLIDNKSQVAVTEGDNITTNFSLVNLSKQSFTDSLSVSYAFQNQASGKTITLSENVSPLSSGDTAMVSFNVSTIGQGGVNDLRVSTSGATPEAITANNRLIYREYATVEADETNPVLDVTFDGIYILNGDIISPDPLVLIRINDENPFLNKEDTSGVELSFRETEDGPFVRVPLTDGKVEWQPATETSDFEIRYRPGPLVDGKYGIRVQGADVTGNLAGDEPYEIEFEVINESTVTHFYPYPNPFSTSCRFVFTLTGSTIPDRIKIQIMTISGRVVREITQDEIGPIRIGNNITQFAWDGTDQYGDKLANGVYLYRVLLRNNNQDLAHRNTQADKAFKNGFGKLYILR